MRMAGPDLVLFVVGLLLFGGASYGIYLQGGLSALSEQHSALGTFDVAYETSVVAVGSPVAISNMRAGEASFDVEAGNVSKVIVTITCSDSQASALGSFTMEVRVAGPTNVSETTATGACGSDIEIPIDVAPVPAATRVAGDDESDARESLAADANATRAQGEWTVTIAGARSGVPGPLGGQVPPPSGTIALSVEQWEPRFTAVQGR